jgi:hypothetical protein
LDAETRQYRTELKIYPLDDPCPCTTPFCLYNAVQVIIHNAKKQKLGPSGSGKASVQRIAWPFPPGTGGGGHPKRE